MLSINTNISSLITQSSMKQSTDKLNQAIERMTTGFKINHASDNAANYSISTNIDTKLGGLKVAEENALQGLEMMNTTSESLSQIKDKLSRMRTLAVQVLNGTYGEQSSNAINLEAESLLAEINRINESATYNGIKLFNTGKKEVTNAGKELELNEQGFLKEVVKVDTSGMTKLSEVDPAATLAVGEYSISTVEELIQLQEMSAAGLLTNGSKFVLANNIDLSGFQWKTSALNGTFNGNGYTISNLKGSNGLFSSVTRIENVRLENVNIVSNAVYVGGIVASGSKIYNCVVEGYIKSTHGSGKAGGIVGYTSTVSYCYANVEIVSNSSNLGGIIGWANSGSSISYCVSDGKISGTGAVGGISGAGSVSNSASYAVISGSSSVGGIVGSANTGVSNCYFGGSVNGNSSVGGILGNSYMFKTPCSNNIVEGSVQGQSNSGVFIGSSELLSSVKNSYYYEKNTGGLSLIGNDNYEVLEVEDITIPTEYTLQIGTSGDEATSTITCTTYIDFRGLKTLLDTGIKDISSITKIDELINIVSIKQSELGMMENRLFSVLDEISIKYDNLISSRSTIRDADIAEVSSHYIQQQILQQASATLLATANQSPAIALQLI